MKWHKPKDEKKVESVIVWDRKTCKSKYMSFSDFFRNASRKEKELLFTEIAKEVAEDQKKIINESLTLQAEGETLVNKL
jgi:hypothetical protein